MTRRYNFSLAQRARIEARQKLRKKEKQAQQAIKKADNRKQQAKRLKESLKAVDAIKSYIEENLCKELNLFMVQVPLIVEVESGMNDMLDRDGSRTPIEFYCGLGLEKQIHASIVQAATKWKRWALKQYNCDAGEGINTDMKAVRKDYFLDHDHSSYVDQWDWEKTINAQDRNLDYLTDSVKKIWKVLKGAETHVQKLYPQLKTDKYPNLPDEIKFLHAEEILDMFLKGVGR